MLQLAAYRQSRERQQGVDVSQGYLRSTDAGLLFDGPRTLEVFFNYQRSTAYQRPAGFTADTLELEIPASNDTLVFYCGRGRVQASIVDGQDYHAAISYDGDTATAYLNGVVVGTITPVNYLAPPAFNIGNATYPPKGPVYFARIYNYAISAEEDAAFYNNGDPEGYVLPLASKYRWEASESDIKNIRFYPNSAGSGVASYLEDNANGFSGRYAHIVPGDSGRLSVYNTSFEGHPVGCVVESKFKYRSSNPFTFIATGDAFPANTADAVEVAIAYRTTGTQITGFSVSVPNADANSWVEVQPVSLRTLGCVAEYLPQNLVPGESAILTPYSKSYTWTGADDATNAFGVQMLRVPTPGQAYVVTITVSNYQAGAPFFDFNGGSNNVAIPAQNGTYRFIAYGSDKSIISLYLYGGKMGTDRRLTLTLNGIIPVNLCQWLDSAKQLPLNDEYLPPLLEPIVIGDATPIHITGENSYTWTGMDDPVYGKTISLSQKLTEGQTYCFTITVSGYEAGTPFIVAQVDNSVYIPAQNGTYKINIPINRSYNGIFYIYGGKAGTDRRLTLTVNSIEPIVERSYDLTANGTPEIVYKPE